MKIEVKYLTYFLSNDVLYLTIFKSNNASENCSFFLGIHDYIKNCHVIIYLKKLHYNSTSDFLLNDMLYKYINEVQKPFFKEFLSQHMADCKENEPYISWFFRSFSQLPRKRLEVLQFRNTQRTIYVQFFIEINF